MAFGLPAFFKDRKQLVVDKLVAKECAIRAIEKLEWIEVGLHPYALDYMTSAAMLNTGERVYVNITDNEIIVRSECVIVTRMLDFGKNKSNIDSFWQIYENEIEMISKN